MKQAETKTKTSESVDNTIVKLSNTVTPRVTSAPESKVDPPKADGIRHWIKATRVRGDCIRAMKFVGLVNLDDIMIWLGKDFYALTNGSPVTIAGKLIQDKAAAEDTSGKLNHLVLIIHDEINNCYHCVAPESWIILDPDFGYTILSEEQFNIIYSRCEQ